LGDPNADPKSLSLPNQPSPNPNPKDVYNEGYVAVTTKAARWYFQAYYILGTLFAFNIIVSSVVNKFTAEYRRIRAEAKAEGIGIGLAMTQRGGSGIPPQFRIDTGADGMFRVSFDYDDDFSATPISSARHAAEEANGPPRGNP